MRVAIIVESRLSSRRLPGKALRAIGGETMLGLLIERLKRARLAQVVCVATSTQAEDAAIAELARAKGVAAYRGALDDVLGRVLGAADSVAADLIVEITGDCPLADPLLIDQAIARFLAGGADYAANMLNRLSYPIGLDVQVYPRVLLAAVDRLCADAALRVDVTPYIYRHGERFRLLGLEAPAPLSRPRYRLCVDRQDDLDLVVEITNALGRTDPVFGAREIIGFLDAHPDLAGRNVHADDAFACPRTVGPCQTEVLPLPEHDPRLRAA
jgi:spore coat polysaccharide biosynthesis protein SpsF